MCDVVHENSLCPDLGLFSLPVPKGVHPTGAVASSLLLVCGQQRLHMAQEGTLGRDLGVFLLRELGKLFGVAWCASCAWLSFLSLHIQVFHSSAWLWPCALS